MSDCSVKKIDKITFGMDGTVAQSSLGLASEEPKLENLSGECRLCLDPFAVNVVSIADPVLKKQMDEVFPFTIEPDQKYPIGVCETCFSIITEFYRYTEKVQSNQQQLSIRITEQTHKLLSYVKEELTMEPSLEITESRVALVFKDEPAPQSEDDQSVHVEHLDVYAEQNDAPKKRSYRKRKKIKSVIMDDESGSDDPEKKPVKPRKYNIKSKEEQLKDEKLISEFYRMGCDLCGDVLVNISSLYSHFRKKHDRKGYVVCCNKKIFKRCFMLDHIKFHTNPSAYRCDICDKSYKNKVYLSIHRIKLHGKEEDRPFKCDRCKQSFAKNYQLRAHMITHEKAQCPICDRLMASKMALATHITNMHSDKDRKLICDTCGKEFLNKTCFERHVKEHQGIEVHPMMQCQICNKWLKGERCLQKHLRYTHYETEQVHTCDICHQNYPNSRALWSHKKVVHVEEKFECEFCGKRFKRAVNLKEHRTIHTGERLYSCKYCGASMNSNANLYTHVKKSHPVEYAEKRQQAANLNAPTKA
ncbi:transcription factor grauzone-like isoform X2 [Armigeres subalbatus]|uniref:transcription factor grauzone-like isoform X2 n=1 Tax=Armigeres subalbatus TaxID=124917 RepID=UPI002ED2A411